MASKKRSVKEIIGKLREAEVALAQGETVAQACRDIGVSDHTFYRWRQQYGGLRIDQARRLREMEAENGRLRRAVFSVEGPGYGSCWASDPASASPPEPPSSCGLASPPTRPFESRTPGTGGMTNRYPLIEAGMSRRDCADWWAARYDRPLERSACVACPFQSRHRWVETKRRWPVLFAEAVEIDAGIRDGLDLAKTPYLHMLRMPLARAVATDEAELRAEGQADGFGNECEGHCGV